MAITERDRLAVRERAHHCCEYCFSQAMLSHDDFSIEHIRPRALDGSDDLSNLALSCQGCNSRKFTATQADDPATGIAALLYNPRVDRWADHFAWNSDYSRMEGLTPTGRATIVRLELNRPPLVRLRRVLWSVGRHPPVELLDPHA